MNYVREFAPGDVIFRDLKDGTTERYVVQNPARTSLGKLRLLKDGATRLTFVWWSHPSTGYPLPPRYRLEEK